MSNNQAQDVANKIKELIEDCQAFKDEEMRENIAIRNNTSEDDIAEAEIEEDI